MLRPGPLIEASHDMHLPCIGGPQGKINPRSSILLSQVTTQFFVKPEVPPLVEQVQVIIGQSTGWSWLRIGHGPVNWRKARVK